MHQATLSRRALLSLGLGAAATVQLGLSACASPGPAGPTATQQVAPGVFVLRGQAGEVDPSNLGRTANLGLCALRRFPKLVRCCVPPHTRPMSASATPRDPLAHTPRRLAIATTPLDGDVTPRAEADPEDMSSEPGDQTQLPRTARTAFHIDGQFAQGGIGRILRVEWCVECNDNDAGFACLFNGWHNCG